MFTRPARQPAIPLFSSRRSSGSRPSRVLLALELFLLPRGRGIHPPTTQSVGDGQTDGGGPDATPNAQLLEQAAGIPPQGEQGVGAAGGGRDAGGVLLEALQVDVAREQQDGHKGHGAQLEGPKVQGRDQGREAGGRHGVVCFRGTLGG